MFLRSRWRRCSLTRAAGRNPKYIEDASFVDLLPCDTTLKAFAWMPRHIVGIVLLVEVNYKQCRNLDFVSFYNYIVFEQREYAYTARTHSVEPAPSASSRGGCRDL